MTKKIIRLLSLYCLLFFICTIMTEIGFESSGNPLIWILYAVIWILYIVSLWKIFTKANLQGWGSIIPFYNVYLQIKLAWKPWWWLLLLFIPFVNIVILIIITIETGRRFGKGNWFIIWMFFLWFIFYPILAFDDSKYTPIVEKIENKPAQ